MLNLSNKQRKEAASVFSLFSCVSSTPSQIDQQTLNPTLHRFIIFTCNKEENK